MMNLALTDKQRGLSFTNLLLWGMVIIIAAIAVMKVVPAYVENRTIASILDKIAHDPEMQGATASEIRLSFDKGASVNNISSVNSSMIEVTPVPGGMVLHVKYDVKVSLFANISLLMEFNTSSARPR